MNNAEKFKQLFGIYATELWAMPEVDFLKWLNEKVQLIQEDTTSDPIDRQTAIEAIKTWGLVDGLSEGQAIEILADKEKLPSADRPQGWVDKAISIIDAMQKEGIIDYEQAWEFRMRARMKGADDE